MPIACAWLRLKKTSVRSSGSLCDGIQCGGRGGGRMHLPHGVRGYLGALRLTLANRSNAPVSSTAFNGILRGRSCA